MPTRYLIQVAVRPLAVPGRALLLIRNGGLTYRPVGRSGDPYPAWVRALKGKSGVYVIRQGGEPVYVGESHSARLYETMTRHFQSVRHEAQEDPMT